MTVSVWGFQERLQAEGEEEHGLEAEKAPSGADVGQKLPEAQGGWRAQTGSSGGGLGTAGGVACAGQKMCEG